MSYRWPVAAALAATILGVGIGPVMLSSPHGQVGPPGTAAAIGHAPPISVGTRIPAREIAKVITASARIGHAGATALTPRGGKIALRSHSSIPPAGASSSIVAIGPPHGVRQTAPTRTELRRRILDTILESPGVHYRELLRRLNCANGTLSFHLHRMERAQLISHIEIGSRRLFYLNRTDPRVDSRLAGTLGRVLAHVRRTPGSSTQEVAHSLDLLPSDASYHLHNLRSMDLARATRVGRHVLWFPNEKA
jgi:DNA-binding MarR family transcriptional regulator